MNNLQYIILLFLLLNTTNQDEEILLTGFLISSDENSNLLKFAFDDDFNTQFMTTTASGGWVGLNFHQKYIITRIEWAQKEEDHSNYLLGIFEGANTKNFEDAIPLYMIKEKGKIREANSIEINFKKRFQYIRYIGPNGKYCKISNLKVYGSEESESDSEYFQLTNLPLFIVHTITGKDFEIKQELIECNFYLVNNNELNINKGGELSLKEAKSLKYDKKSYNVRFEGSVQPLDFKSKSANWVLLGNYGDKTLIRNFLTFEISKIFNMTYTTDCKFVDLIINGEYKGTYNLCEKIEVLKTRINIKELSKSDNSDSKISGGYIIEVDGFAYLGNLYFNSRKGIPVTIIYPEQNDISSQQKNYIRETFNDLELEIYNNNITNIDITSFVKFFLIEELIGNAEAYWSTFLYKDRNDDKFYFGPISDNEMIFDNDNRVYPTNCKKEYIFNSGLSAGTMDKFINLIIKNELIINKTKEVWKEITSDKINSNDLNQFIDEQVELIKESKNLNFMRWDILNKKVSFNPKIYGSYEEEINYLKDFIKNRINLLSNYILSTNKEVKVICNSKSNEQNIITKELNYEIDSDVENNEKDYQLLSFSNIKIKNLFLLYINISLIFLLYI